MLREYIQLLIQILDEQSQKIDSTVFRLQSATREQAGMAKKAVLDRIAECESLQDQLRVFRDGWRGHMASFPQYGCYDEAPAHWAKNAMNGNAERIQEARRKMNDIDIAEMTHQLRRERLAESAAKQRRARNPVAGPLTAMLSYSDTMSMKPAVKGKSNMSNKEWKRFKEECLEWFEATAIGRPPQSSQTRLVESVLDDTF